MGAAETAQARQMLRKILDGMELDAEPVERDGRRGVPRNLARLKSLGQ